MISIKFHLLHAVLICSVCGIGAVIMEDCINTEIFCYHCDSDKDVHCGDPFEFSHYYVSTDYYMTVCYGCCVKITQRSMNGEQRILRSCTENLPFFNVTLKDDDADCEVADNENVHRLRKRRHVCICENSFCNTAVVPRGKSFLYLLLSYAVTLISK